MNSVDSSPDPNTQSFTIHYLEKSNKIIDLFLSYFFLFLLSISSTFLKSRVNALSMPFFVIPMERKGPQLIAMAGLPWLRRRCANPSKNPFAEIIVVSKDKQTFPDWKKQDRGEESLRRKRP